MPILYFADDGSLKRLAYALKRQQKNETVSNGGHEKAKILTHPKSNLLMLVAHGSSTSCYGLSPEDFAKKLVNDFGLYTVETAVPITQIVFHTCGVGAITPFDYRLQFAVALANLRKSNKVFQSKLDEITVYAPSYFCETEVFFHTLEWETGVKLKTKIFGVEENKIDKYREKERKISPCENIKERLREVEKFLHEIQGSIANNTPIQHLNIKLKFLESCIELLKENLEVANDISNISPPNEECNLIVYLEKIKTNLKETEPLGEFKKNKNLLKETLTEVDEACIHLGIMKGFFLENTENLTKVIAKTTDNYVEFLKSDVNTSCTLAQALSMEDLKNKTEQDPAQITELHEKIYPFLKDKPVRIILLKTLAQQIDLLNKELVALKKVHQFSQFYNKSKDYQAFLKIFEETKFEISCTDNHIDEIIDNCITKVDNLLVKKFIDPYLLAVKKTFVLVQHNRNQEKEMLQSPKIET